MTNQPFTPIHIDINLLLQIGHCGWDWHFFKPFDGDGQPLYGCKMIKDNRIALGYGRTLESAMRDAATVIFKPRAGGVE